MRLKDEFFIFEKGCLLGRCQVLPYTETTPNPYMDGINFTPYGNYNFFWNYMCQKYSERTLLPRFNDLNIGIDGFYGSLSTDINLELRLFFIANKERFNHMLKTTEPYEMFDPYHIREEHLIGGRIANTTNTIGGSTTTHNETSMDNLTAKEAYNDATTSRTDTSSSANNLSEKHEELNQSLSNNATISHTLDTRIGNIGNHIYADIINKERAVGNFVLWDYIAKEVADKLTYRII